MPPKLHDMATLLPFCSSRRVPTSHLYLSSVCEQHLNNTSLRVVAHPAPRCASDQGPTGSPEVLHFDQVLHLRHQPTQCQLAVLVLLLLLL